MRGSEKKESSSKKKNRNVLVGVESVDNQRHELIDICREGKGFGFGVGHCSLKLIFGLSF